MKSYSRAPKRKYEEIYKNLPVEIKDYDFSDAEKICEKCGTKIVCIGNNSYREIEYTPAILKVIEHRRKKYACKNCDSNALEGNLKAAPAPYLLFDHGIASPSLIAHIICKKR